MIRRPFCLDRWSTPFRWRVFVCRRAVDVVMAVLLIAGMAKLLDLNGFVQGLTTWVFVPKAAILPIAFVVPSCEVLIALFWFLKVSRTKAVLVALLLLTTFTLFYLAHVIFADPPDCNCFARIQFFHDTMSDARVVVGRNLVLCTLLVGFLLIGRQQRAMEGH